MKRSGILIVSFFLLLIVASIYVYHHETSSYSKTTDTVLPNKIWYITFNEQIDGDTVNKDTVYVLDDKGKKIENDVSLSENGTTIVIKPPAEGYSPHAKEYTLTIEKELKLKNGQTINEKIEKTFHVIDTIPTIGSKKNLDSYFENILENERDIVEVFTAETAQESNVTSDANERNVEQFSETNVQVQGIDEGDIVKTDGTYIYQLIDGKMNIIKADEKNLTLEKTVSFEGTFSPMQLFLHDEKVIVIGHVMEEYVKRDSSGMQPDIYIAPISEETKAIVYNVSDVKNPIKEKEITLDGGFLSARKKENYIYFVTNKYPPVHLLREGKEVDLRPKYSDSAIEDKHQTVSYDQIYYFPEKENPTYTLIGAMNVDDLSKEMKVTTFLGSGREIYMSDKNIYIAVENWNEVESKDDTIMYGTWSTNVYKFSVNGLKVKFDQSAEVEGTILNQFSMDEYNGNFRIATTKHGLFNQNESSNHLYIFDEKLQQLSSINDLARGERIYSARFMGERIYIVTFKQTDPLFVINAKDPKNPKVEGELKIPGFSNYLHPLDNNHLIGFGQDTKLIPQKDGKEPLILTEGVKISIFDVSNMNDPKEKFTEIIGGRGTYSPLNYDHKTLLFRQEDGLFAFPIHVYKNVKGSVYESEFEFQGAYVYHISADNGLDLKTKISHLEKIGPYEEWTTAIHRLLYIGDTLYALSPSKITAHHIGDYKLVGELELNHE